MTELTKQLIKKHGEQYRRLIADALDWLDRREPVWKLTGPMDREKFIEDLIQCAVQMKEATGDEPKDLRFVGGTSRAPKDGVG